MLTNLCIHHLAAGDRLNKSPDKPLKSKSTVPFPLNFNEAFARPPSQPRCRRENCRDVRMAYQCTVIPSHDEAFDGDRNLRQYPPRKDAK